MTLTSSRYRGLPLTHAWSFTTPLTLLIATFNRSSADYRFGVGLAFQNALLAIQAEYSDRTHLVPQATGVISFFQLTGAAIGIGIVNTVQSVYLNSELKAKAPEAPFAVVRQSVEAIKTLPEALQPAVVDAYVTAITKSFVPIIVAVGLALFFGAAVRNHSLKEKGVKAGEAAA
jgi:hypothetical protein